MIANPRTVIVLMSIYYDKSDPGETERAKNLYLEMGETTQQAGYQQYRTSTLYMDKILKTAPEFKKLADTIKTAPDPQGVLSPGKYGINTKKWRKLNPLPQLAVNYEHENNPTSSNFSAFMVVL